MSQEKAMAWTKAGLGLKIFLGLLAMASLDAIHLSQHILPPTAFMRFEGTSLETASWLCG